MAEDSDPLRSIFNPQLAHAADIDYERSHPAIPMQESITGERMKIDRLTPTPAMLRELGERLAHIRKQQGFSQADLAAAAGVGVATLRRIEDGRDGKLGSWLRLLLSLQMEAAVDQLLPADFRSPLAEVKGRRKRSKPRAPADDRSPDASTDRGFVWGDQQP